MSDEITAYPFPDDLSENGYCLFPKALEDDALVLFHATPAENLQAIMEEGFRADPQQTSGLSSVSFAKQSVSALSHAMTRRGDASIEFVVLAVRYDSLEHKHITVNVSDIHDYRLDPPPQIVGKCVIPAAYRYV